MTEDRNELWILVFMLFYGLFHMLFNLTIAMILLSVLGSFLLRFDLISNALYWYAFAMFGFALLATGCGYAIVKLGGELPKLPMLFDKM